MGGAAIEGCSAFRLAEGVCGGSDGCRCGGYEMTSRPSSGHISLRCFYVLMFYAPETGEEVTRTAYAVFRA